MSESKQCPKCESQLPQRLSSGTIICRQCGWSGRLENNSVEIPAKDNKSIPLINSPVWKSAENFIKTRNGERFSLVIGTFIISSAFWYIFNPFKNQNNILDSSSVATTKSQDAQSNNTNSSAEKGSNSQSTNSYTINGILALGPYDGTPNNCYGQGGYSDIKGETSVTIKDGTGKIIAVGKTSLGYMIMKDSYGVGKTIAIRDDVMNYPSKDYGLTDFRAVCNFEFTVNNIPKSDFYVISVGNRGDMNYSFDEMQKENWVVSLGLGIRGRR
jgi:hypothetical protein